VLVRGDGFAIVRQRPTFQDMLAAEARPEWLDAAQGPATARSTG
jgi:hypothetical protein